jgi:hypothetical protein
VGSATSSEFGRRRRRNGFDSTEVTEHRPNMKENLKIGFCCCLHEERKLTVFKVGF